MEFRPGGRIGETANSRFGEALRGIALDSEDVLYAVGDSAVKVFAPDGGLLREWSTGAPGHSIAVAPDGRIWVGQWQGVEIFDHEGARRDVWSEPEQLGLITAIGFFGDDVFLADASARCIHRFGADRTLVNHIGDRHRKGGFHIPNGVVDFAVDGEGILHVANPGMHRVESYRADGELLGHFGRFDGRDPAGFPGCCNPTNLTLDPAGRIVVTEKAGPRAKVYTPDGELLTVVADTGFEPEAKNMDCAVDSGGRIYVADTARRQILVFEPVTAGAAG